MKDRADEKPPMWYNEAAGDIDAFRAEITRDTDLADLPRAAEIASRIPIYNGPALTGLDGEARKALMSEWAWVLLDGPGVIAIRNAYPDTAPVDRATALFERLIERERATGAGGGDHFAKPGANDRVWNAAEKHCLADPEGFALYYANPLLAWVSEAWLGPGYQVTAQVNRVNPGGAAQTPHRDYHLGFMSAEAAAAFPAHIHRLSPALTLQGAIAHCDMALESGPTMLLPYSQRLAEGYVAFHRPEFQAAFAEHHAQLPLAKGDMVFFNPALMHGAGTNRTADVRRMANLLQVSSPFGRAIETVDRAAMARALFAPLQSLVASNGLSRDEAHAAIAAAAEGYPFPTNLDTDPPVGGLAPKSLVQLTIEALEDGTGETAFHALVDAWEARRKS